MYSTTYSEPEVIDSTVRKFTSKEELFAADLTGVKVLDITGLDLTRLPKLPEGLEVLTVKHNPDLYIGDGELPDSLLKIFACDHGRRYPSPSRPSWTPAPAPERREEPAIKPQPAIQPEKEEKTDEKDSDAAQETENSAKSGFDISRWPPNLEVCYLCGSHIINLPRTMPPHMREFFAEETNLNVLPMLNPGLRHLRVSGSPIGELGKLPATLQRLYAEDCGLTALPQLAHTRLKELYVQNNRLREIPELPPTIEELYVDGNELKRLPMLKDKINLREVYASNNKIEEIPEFPPQMEEILLTNNRIKDVRYINVNAAHFQKIGQQFSLN